MGRWRPHDPATRVRVTDEGVVLEPTSGNLVLVRDGPFEAEDIHALEVVLGLQLPTALTLRSKWGRGFPRASGVWQLRPGALRGPLTERRGRFELSADPDWHGPVRRLRLVIRQSRPLPVLLHKLAGIRTIRSATSIAAQAATPWWIRVGDELRDGWLVPPDRPWTRTLTVPPGASLRFASAVSDRSLSAADLKVVIDDGVAETVILESSLVDDDRGEVAWRDHTADLTPWSGQGVTVRIESRVDEGWDPGHGIPVVANPRVLRPGTDPRPDILLISVDTFRADRLPAAEAILTPRLDRWWRHHATFFANATAQAPWTLPSHTSMLTGLDAVHHGVNRWTRGAPDALTTLAERLREAGYHTAALTGGGSLDPGYGLNQGFDRFRMWTRARQDGRVELEAHLDRARAWLAAAPRPTFLFLHTFAVHDYLRVGDLPLLAREAVAERTARYDDAVRHLDEHLGAFLESLADSGRLRQTVVVLTSDHGEELGEHGIFGHGSLRETLMRVPLVIAHPQRKTVGQVVESQVRSVDLVPTLLDLVDLPPGEPLDGRSLVPMLEGATPTLAGTQRIATFYRSSATDGLALRTGSTKYWLNNDLGSPTYGAEALFDLGADPEERLDLAQDRPTDAARLRDAARRLLDQRLPGLVVTLINRSPEPFSGTLGSLDHPKDQVKSAEPPCDCVELADGVLRFELAPGERFRFVLEEPGHHPLHVRARLGAKAGRAWQSIELDPTRDRSVMLDAAGWRDASPASGPRAGIVLERRGAFVEDGVPYELDPELRARLQALGYLQ